jgi:hypothetical protein
VTERMPMSNVYVYVYVGPCARRCAHRLDSPVQSRPSIAGRIGQPQSGPRVSL